MFEHITATSDIEELFSIFEVCLRLGKLDQAIGQVPEAWRQGDKDWLAWNDEQAIVLMTGDTIDPSGQTPLGQPWLDIVDYDDVDDEEEE